MKNLSGFRKRAITLLLLINALALGVAVGYTLLVDRLTEIGLFTCSFKDTFHLYCPGCGGSRSVAHLLKFDFYSSFRSYPPMMIFLFFSIDLELRGVMAILRDDKRALTGFNLNWLISIPVAIIIHFVLRNVFLLCFGLDYLGDILG